MLLEYFRLSVILVLVLSLVGCAGRDNIFQRSSPVSPAQSLYSLDYIKSMRMSYSTSRSLLRFDKNFTKMPFPENTKGVVLRISGENVPAEVVISVNWYFIGEGKKLVYTQKVLPEELNSLQYVDFLLYHPDAEFPKGNYEVEIKEENNNKMERLSFSVL